MSSKYFPLKIGSVYACPGTTELYIILSEPIKSKFFSEEQIIVMWDNAWIEHYSWSILGEMDEDERLA